MTIDRFMEILLAVLSLVIGYSAYRFATRAHTEQGKAAIVAVDAAAYERAKEIYESALATLRRELSITRAELVSARGEIASLRSELITVRTELAVVRKGQRDPPA